MRKFNTITVIARHYLHTNLRIPLRPFSQGSHKGSSSNGRSNSSDGHDASGDEPIGRGLILIGCSSFAAMALYFISEPSAGEKHIITRWIEALPDHREEWKRRNTLHTKMVEQAAFDRMLFYNSKPNPHIDLSFPEIFNTGSQSNVPAGNGSANLEEVIAFYEKKNREEQERKLQMLRDGTLPCEQEPRRRSG